MRDKLIFSMTFLWLVAFSVFATVLFSLPLFSLNIGWENLTEISGLSHELLMKNYNALMAYLLNPLQSELIMPDFPSSTGALEHFAQVKWLFLLVIFLVFALDYFVFKFIVEHLYLVFHRGIILSMIVPLALALFTLLVGFDNFFIFFHKILFRDSTWLFDPVTDPIINVLTANFFMYCFIIFAVIYELIWLLFLLKGKNWSSKILIKNHKKKESSNANKKKWKEAA